MGGYAITYAAGVLFLGLFVPRFASAHHSFRDISLLLALVVPIAVVGVGLLYLRKWAAFGLSLLALYLAYWCFWAGLHPKPGNADWLGFIYGLLLVAPSILTAKYWNLLVWRKRPVQTRQPFV